MTLLDNVIGVIGAVLLFSGFVILLEKMDKE